MTVDFDFISIIINGFEKYICPTHPFKKPFHPLFREGDTLGSFVKLTFSEICSFFFKKKFLFVTI